MVLSNETLNLSSSTRVPSISICKTSELEHNGRTHHTHRGRRSNSRMRRTAEWTSTATATAVGRRGRGVLVVGRPFGPLGRRLSFARRVRAVPLPLAADTTVAHRRVHAVGQIVFHTRHVNGGRRNARGVLSLTV